MPLVLVQHPDVGQAQVPLSALRQMDPRWQLVEQPPADDSENHTSTEEED